MQRALSCREHCRHAESTVMQRALSCRGAGRGSPLSILKATSKQVSCTSVTRESRKRSVQFPSNKRWNRESNPSPLPLPTYCRLPGYLRVWDSRFRLGFRFSIPDLCAGDLDLVTRASVWSCPCMPVAFGALSLLLWKNLDLLRLSSETTSSSIFYVNPNCQST